MVVPRRVPVVRLPTVTGPGNRGGRSGCAARRDIGPDDVIDGIRISGAATFVAEVMADGAQALVY